MSTESFQVMVVEDDPKLAHAITKFLRGEGFGSTRCGTGTDALAYFRRERVDAVILDLGLPDLDGMEVLAEIRAASVSLPVLILTARDAVSDRIAGLDGGADDYLVKPCALPELSARIRALARRVELGRSAVLQCLDLRLDPTHRTARRADDDLVLSPREFDLLLYLLKHQGEVVTRSMLAAEVWQYASRVTPIDNIIDVQVSRLRDKVDKPYPVRLLHTVRGVGFKLEVPS
jgi:DNA-binding response OmpR family regulator